MYDTIDNIDKYIERERDKEHCGDFDGFEGMEYEQEAEELKRDYETLGEELEDEIIKMRIRKGTKMNKFNESVTKIVIEVETRGYELMGVKPSSIHPDEYGELFVILVKRDEGRYVIWSATVQKKKLTSIGATTLMIRTTITLSLKQYSVSMINKK